MLKNDTFQMCDAMKRCKIGDTYLVWLVNSHHGRKVYWRRLCCKTQSSKDVSIRTSPPPGPHSLFSAVLTHPRSGRRLLIVDPYAYPLRQPAAGRRFPGHPYFVPNLRFLVDSPGTTWHSGWTDQPYSPSRCSV